MNITKIDCPVSDSVVHTRSWGINNLENCPEGFKHPSSCYSLCRYKKKEKTMNITRESSKVQSEARKHLMSLIDMATLLLMSGVEPREVARTLHEKWDVPQKRAERIAYGLASMIEQ